MRKIIPKYYHWMLLLHQCAATRSIQYWNFFWRENDTKNYESIWIIIVQYSGFNTMKRGGAGGSGAFVSACNRRSPFPITFQSSCIRPVTGGCDMRLDINTLTDIALPKHLMKALNVPCVYSSVLLLCIAPHALSHKHTPLDTHSFTPRVL